MARANSRWGVPSRKYAKCVVANHIFTKLYTSTLSRSLGHVGHTRQLLKRDPLVATLSHVGIAHGAPRGPVASAPREEPVQQDDRPQHQENLDDQPAIPCRRGHARGLTRIGRTAQKSKGTTEGWKGATCDRAHVSEQLVVRLVHVIDGRTDIGFNL
eukprot:5684013-Prymnesium_polylepis.1